MNRAAIPTHPCVVRAGRSEYAAASLYAIATRPTATVNSESAVPSSSSSQYPASVACLNVGRYRSAQGRGTVGLLRRGARRSVSSVTGTWPATAMVSGDRRRRPPASSSHAADRSRDGDGFGACAVQIAYLSKSRCFFAYRTTTFQFSAIILAVHDHLR